ncbi:hypothetical protein JYT97_01925 [Haliea sp. AH-315-K21]|uniref:Uncharacterized protein n=1 Tax=SAR86 cluster bacterium TaxID=2030880 RepID=A0A2A5CCG2_9GAMM|nr:hypothetical protein [Haliea sp. AH-315-K21]PCJ41208.1 MAG: hypothetical protein COA71_09225 [SAR86 cluster bacterium]
MSETQQKKSPGNVSTAEADLALIRKMMLEAQASAALDGRYLVLWGIVLSLAQAFDIIRSILTSGPANEWTAYIWFVMLGIGIVGSIVLGYLHSRGPINSGARMYASIWIGFCLTMCLLFTLAVSGQGALLSSLAIIAPAMTGLAFFATAAIINLGWLRWVALGWWLIAILVSVLDSSSYTGFIYIAAYLGLMAGPGLAIMRLGKKA